jgi:hypothetical protein
VKEINHVLVHKNHRNQDPASGEYEFFDDYSKRMKEENGLEISYFHSFVVPSNYSCFEVVDEGKAFRFVMLNSEFFQKPTELFDLDK